MANQSKLKAWVRYDGTNTVVTAGPIFRAAKPKVGNWRQINADLCCNDSGSTTTTSTTSIPGTTTTTSSTTSNVLNAPIVGASSTFNACIGSGDSMFVYFTAPVGNGTTLWLDSNLTNPYNPSLSGGFVRLYFDAQEQVCYMNNNVIDGYTACSSVTTTTTTTIASYYFLAYPGNSSNDACNHVNNSISVYANTTILGTLINLYMDPALTIPYNPIANGEYLSIYFNAADQVCTMSGNMINSYTSCG